MFSHLENGTLRIAAFVNHFIVFVSSVIVTGLISSFLHDFSFRGTHVVYQEVIATITMAFWLVGMVLPLIGRYKGYLMPVNLVFSYLWLTSFIFSAEDWSRHRCSFNPPGLGRCGQKHTVEAFTFFAFFFLLCNTVVEALLLRSAYHPGRVTEKNGATPATAQVVETTNATAV